MAEEPHRDLTDRIRSVLRARPEVVFAYLFGSRAEGSPHGASDVDVAVYLEEEDGNEDTEAGSGDGDHGGIGAGGGRRHSGRERLEAWTEIHADLVDALASTVDGIGLRHRGHAPEGVDLLVLNDAPPLLADRVIRSGRLLLSRSEPERLRWVVRTKSRYCDLRLLRRRLDQTVSERLATGRFGRSGPASQADRGPAGDPPRSQESGDGRDG